MNNEDLPGRVRAERKRRKWTQEDMAKKTGMSLRAYQMFETRKSEPQGENLRAILRAVDIGQNGDEAEAAHELPRDVEVFLDMLGAYLMTMSDAMRLEAIHDLTRQIFNANRAT